MEVFGEGLEFSYTQNLTAEKLP